MRKLHKILGLTFGLIITLVTATGCLLIFTEELNLHEHTQIEPESTIVDYRAPLADILEKYPGSRIRSIYLPRIAGEAGAKKSWLIFLQRPDHEGRWVAQLNPHTGEITSEHDYGGTLFRWIFSLHTGTLFGGWGGVLFWLSAFALFFSGLSGFWIYRKAIRRLFDWRFLRRSWRKPVILHSTIGTWSLCFILLLSSTGAFLMYLVVPPKLKAPTPITATDPRAIRALSDLSATHQRVTEAVPGSKIAGISFKVSDPAASSITYTLLDRSAMPWRKWSRAYVDGITGQITRIERPEDATLYHRIVMTAVTLHFGFYGSEPTQWIYFVFGLLILTMPASGLWIWWRRKQRIR